MIQIAICDDDAGELEKAGALLETYCGLHRDADMVCRRFSSGAELLACVNTGVLFDIYLLDILMPGLTGIEVGAAIRETDRDAAIVFLSSSDEFGVTSYRVRAYDYLIKPVEEANLFPTLDELLKQIAARRINTFPIPSSCTGSYTWSTGITNASTTWRTAPSSRASPCGSPSTR